MKTWFKNLTVVACMLTASNAIAGVAIQDTIPYENPDRVDSRITAECKSLGENFSTSIDKYGKEFGVEVTRSAGDISKNEVYANIRIVSALSIGNAFTGHRKSVTVETILYKNGAVLGKKMMTRDSGGGAFAGFKSSCDVLDRTVNTLGSDVVKWLKSINLVSGATTPKETPEQ